MMLQSVVILLSFISVGSARFADTSFCWTNDDCTNFFEECASTLECKISSRNIIGLMVGIFITTTVLYCVCSIGIRRRNVSNNQYVPPQTQYSSYSINLPQTAQTANPTAQTANPTPGPSYHRSCCACQ